MTIDTPHNPYRLVWVFFTEREGAKRQHHFMDDPLNRRKHRLLPLPGDRLSTHRRGCGRTGRAGVVHRTRRRPRRSRNRCRGHAADTEGCRPDGSVRPRCREGGHALSPGAQCAGRAQQGDDRWSGLLIPRRRRSRGQAPLRRCVQRGYSDRRLSLRPVDVLGKRSAAQRQRGGSFLQRGDTDGGHRSRCGPARLSEPHHDRVGC